MGTIMNRSIICVEYGLKFYFSYASITNVVHINTTINTGIFLDIPKLSILLLPKYYIYFFHVSNFYQSFQKIYYLLKE